MAVTYDKTPVKGFFTTTDQLYHYADKHIFNQPKYDSPEKLWAECVKYFEWNLSTPMEEAKSFVTDGEIVIGKMAKARVMSAEALCLFIGITHKQWIEWKKNPDHLLSKVILFVESVIRKNKFEGAAAGFYKENIISRDLGLMDRQMIEEKRVVLDASSVITEGMSAKEAADMYSAMLKGEIDQS